jgi:hypothetical protein
MLLEKIKTEVTLNSAAQAVVDEIKRDFDDSCKAGQLDLREDLTLIVRVFHKDLKGILNEQYDMTNSYDSLNSTLGNSNSTTSSQISNDSEKQMNSFDENGYVLPYCDFNQFNNIVSSDQSACLLLAGFEAELENLSNIDDNSRL